MLRHGMEVTKSEYDNKEYRALKLDNGLRVLLVRRPCSANLQHKRDHVTARTGGEESEEEEEDGEDSNSDSSDDQSLPGSEDTRQQKRRKAKMTASSACAVCIRVGSFCDPPEVPGLAHLVEHMVFMGSEKYPDENSFDMYCSKHGGYTDANTDYESTVYYFTINKNYFADALDRFAHFFISPLFRPSSLEREIEAIDNEFQESIRSDSNRLQQLLCSLSCSEHPLSNFAWGNSATLKKNPKRTRINVVDHLKSFYHDFFSASYMTMVLVSGDSLDFLETLARNSFSEMRTDHKSPPSFEKHQHVFDMSTFHRLYKVQPAVMDKHQLRITWILPSQFNNYRVKPMCYLGWLLGHEGKGSVLSYLRNRQFASELTAGNGEEDYEYNSSFALFTCTITLTELGVKNIFQCLTCVFQYLKMLRHYGPQERIFKEIQTAQENEFNFFNEEDAQDTAERLSLAMQFFPPTEYLTGNDIMYEYNPQVISSVQDLLLPDRCNIIVLSRQFKKQCIMKEKWFGTKYTSEAINPEWTNTWKELQCSSDLHLPEPNPFIATDLSLKSADAPLTMYPVVIAESDKFKLWYKKDELHGLPIASARFLLKSQLHTKSVENVVLMELFIKLYQLVIVEAAYDAEVAHLQSCIFVHHSGISITIDGLNQKLPVLFEFLVDKMIDFDVSEVLFQTVKV